MNGFTSIVRLLDLTYNARFTAVDVKRNTAMLLAMWRSIRFLTKSTMESEECEIVSDYDQSSLSVLEERSYEGIDDVTERENPWLDFVCMIPVDGF